MHATVPVALSVVVAIGLSGCSSGGGGKDESQKTAQEFLAAWQAGDIAKAAGLTDDPAKATSGLTDAAKQLQLKAGEYAAKDYKKGSGDDPGTLAYHAKVTVQGIATPVEWDSAVPVVKKDGKTVVHWQSTIVHPQYADGAKFSNSRKTPERAPILDRNGQPLAGAMPVVAISLWPAKMTNPDAVYAALGDPVFDVDVAKLKERVGKSDPNQAVAVVTLRKEVYESQARTKLANLPGVQLADQTRQTATTAKQVVGTVGDASAEILSKPGYENAGTGDQVGVSGLQARYQAQLGGTATTKLTIKGANGQDVATLVDIQGKPGTPVKTTIDPKLQSEAEKAMTGLDKNAAIVAIDAKTGEIRAVANNPATGDNRAFTGRYAPGSTFKTVTAAALIQAGLKPNDPAACDNTVVVNGQTFKNYDGLAPIPNANFGKDFQESCNTGFISQRDRIQDDTLTKVANDVFGIGESWDVGTSTFDGSVPPATSPNEKAASMIGQGKVQASPLVMASVAATIDSGTFNQPVIVTDPAPKRVAAKPVDPALAAQLKSLMQSVVAGGTAKMLQGIPGTVGAKTGTAEFSEGGQVLTNGWMIAFKDDIAVAVLVEKGESGGKAAGPIVQKFLSAV
jgi:cell division protein FtsI/penicillin-binding protein 2